MDILPSIDIDFPRVMRGSDRRASLPWEWPAPERRARLAAPIRRRRWRCSPAPLLALVLAMSALASKPDGALAAPARGASAITATTGEKQRVPKPPPEQPKTKPEKPGSKPDPTSTGDHDDGGSDFLTSCLTDCIGSCIESLLEGLWDSMFSRNRVVPSPADSARSPESFLADTNGIADTLQFEDSYEPHAWARHDVGYLRAHLPGESVVLRPSPSDPDSLALEAGRLPDGARVLVTATRTGPAGTMLEVRPVDTPGASGWVHEKSVRQAPYWSPSPADTTVLEAVPADTLGTGSPEPDSLAVPPGPEASTPPEVPAPTPDARSLAQDRRGERWALVLGAGPAVIDNPGLASDYANAALALEAEYLRVPRSSWVLGAGAGYRGYSGVPQVEYVGATEIDSPERSRFRLAYAMVEVGLRRAWREGLRIGVMVGPVVGFVHEDADVRVLDAQTRARLGSRHEAMDRWTAGGGGTAWAGVALPFPVELGLRIRVIGLAWDGRHQKSLTSDYTDEGLLHLDAAIILTHAGH